MSTSRLFLQLVAAAAQPYKPIIAHMVVTRRCNLSCGYCFEYDKVSKPVPTETLEQRIDHVASLGTMMLTLTGGETLLHPDAAELVAYIRGTGMTPLMNTNGYLLTRDRIEQLNDAGLFGLQLSIDNVRPNDVTKKSLKPLLPKLRLLAEHAKFRVRINTVLGSGPPAEAVQVARTVVDLGFDTQCSLVRDETGAIKPLDDESRRAYDEITSMGRRVPRPMSSDGFQTKLMDEGRVDWKCRAGARTFHIDELGLVHLCAPRTGFPGKPIEDYTRADIEQFFHMPKACAATCPVAYAHLASRLDGWRAQDGAAYGACREDLHRRR